MSDTEIEAVAARASNLSSSQPRAATELRHLCKILRHLMCAPTKSFTAIGRVSTEACRRDSRVVLGLRVDAADNEWPLKVPREYMPYPLSCQAREVVVSWGVARSVMPEAI